MPQQTANWASMRAMQNDSVRAARQLVHTLVPRDEMKVLMLRDNARAAWQLAAHVAVLSVLAAMVGLSSGTWLVWPAMFVLGIALTHLFAPQHECAHYSAFRSRWLDSAVAWTCGLLIVVPQLHFRYEHTDHHSYTNLPAQDPQHIPMSRSIAGYLLYLSALPYWWSAWNGLVRRAGGRLTEQEQGFIPSGERSKVIWEARAMLLVYLSVAALVAGGWHAPVIYWFLPLVLGQPVMRFIRMTEHVGLPTVIDPLQNTRTTEVGVVWRLLAWNMNYHAEHHLAPAVPYHALPRLHRLTLERIPVRRGYLAGHREIWHKLRSRARPTVP